VCGAYLAELSQAHPLLVVETRKRAAAVRHLVEADPEHQLGVLRSNRSSRLGEPVKRRPWSAKTWRVPSPAVSLKAMSPIARGFFGRRESVEDASRVPPGQYVTRDFPVLSAGPTPYTALDAWSFTIGGQVDEPVSWTWEEFLALPSETPTVDIHCVTKWTKLDTTWRGVSVDTLLSAVNTEARYLTAWSDGGYTTNLALDDVTDGRAWVAYEFGGALLESEHGGPARLLVPHLYFWKSAKWVRGLTLTPDDEPGFWESYGYHNHGDPWLEQRYQGD
jgi:DMSO/TMAO reductase YedYZ molybdopterin-dependent catalytic subunit